MVTTTTRADRVSTYQRVLGRLALVDEVGVEDIELVPLHDLWWRVVHVVMGLVVLVPLEASVHSADTSREMVYSQGDGRFKTNCYAPLPALLIVARRECGVAMLQHSL